MPSKTKKIIICIMGAGFLFALMPVLTYAQEGVLLRCDDANFISQVTGKVHLNIPLPGVTETLKCIKTTGGIQTHNFIGGDGSAAISTYIKGFYVYFVWVVGILAAVMTMYAGIQWLTAAGDASKITNAKSTMNGAVIGLILVLTSYVLLAAINPDLVKLRVPSVIGVKPKFAGDFCRTLDGIDYQKYATGAEVYCGDVYHYEDSKKEKGDLFCLSQSCPYNTQSCLPCKGEHDPYDSCTGGGYQCGYYDNFIEIRGKVVSVVDGKKLNRIELWRTCPDCDNDKHKVGTLEGEENFELNKSFILKSESQDPVPLTQFWLDVYFESGTPYFHTLCKQADPENESNCFIFEIPITPGGPATKEFNFDFQKIWNRCGMPCS
ncbi:MAG: pilin [bacterium]